MVPLDKYGYQPISSRWFGMTSKEFIISIDGEPSIVTKGIHPKPGEDSLVHQKKHISKTGNILSTPACSGNCRVGSEERQPE